MGWYTSSGRGDIFGISVDNLNSVVKSNYSVHALTFCDMNKIEAYDLQDIFDMYPEFTENFKKKFSLTFNLKMVWSPYLSSPFLFPYWSIYISHIPQSLSISEVL